MIAYSRPKRFDLYTLCQSQRLENHTLHSGTYLYGPHMTVPPRALYLIYLSVWWLNTQSFQELAWDVWSLIFAWMWWNISTRKKNNYGVFKSHELAEYLVNMYPCFVTYDSRTIKDRFSKTSGVCNLSFNSVFTQFVFFYNFSVNQKQTWHLIWFQLISIYIVLN